MTSPEAIVTPVTHVLYLHGFRSSPKSFKATTMARWFAEHRPDVVYACPQLPHAPADAIEHVSQITRDWPAATMAAVGSSLGGFYATVFAERRGGRAVVLNPTVNPARDLDAHIGTQTVFHDPDQSFEFTHDHVRELLTLTPAVIRDPSRYAAVIAKGDEVLDWREMRSRYQGARMLILEGGDHALTHFDLQLPFVLEFLGCV